MLLIRAMERADRVEEALLVSHDEHFVTDIATRAMVLSAKGLHEANIHQHLHQHHHPHIHPKLPKE